jgi:hypothetical protein
MISVLILQLQQYMFSSSHSKLILIGAALANNATTFSTGAKKSAFYLNGDHYDLGFLTAILAPEALLQAATTYIDLLPLELISQWAEKYIFSSFFLP